MEVLTVHSDVLKQIWKPDLFFSNEKDAATHKIVTENALIRYLYCFATVFTLNTVKGARRRSNIHIDPTDCGGGMSHVLESLSHGCPSVQFEGLLLIHKLTILTLSSLTGRVVWLRYTGRPFRVGQKTARFGHRPSGSLNTHTHLACPRNSQLGSTRPINHFSAITVVENSKIISQTHYNEHKLKLA